MSGWWSAENAVVEQGRGIDPELTRFCDEAIELLEGIDCRVPQSDDEIVRAIALTHVRNTLLVSWECAFAGYVAQAMALCRTASEYIGVAWYAEEGPADIQAWLVFGADAPRKAGALLRKVLTDPQLEPSFRLMREQLRPFIHADTAALGSIVTMTPDGSGGVKYLIDVGPVVNERRFRAAAFFLVMVSGLAVLRTTQWLDGIDPEWGAAADDHMGRVGDWLANVEP